MVQILFCKQKLPDEYHHAGPFALSSWLGPAILGSWDVHLLVGLERFGWWLHYFVVLAFLNYLPFSKHLHVILAFPNTYFAKLNVRGEMANMPIIMNEVRTSMELEPMPNTPVMQEGEMPTFGANDVFSLGWTNILNAYTCTECGRCTASCPANINR